MTAGIQWTQCYSDTIQNIAGAGFKYEIAMASNSLFFFNPIKSLFSQQQQQKNIIGFLMLSG